MIGIRIAGKGAFIVSVFSAALFLGNGGYASGADSRIVSRCTEPNNAVAQYFEVIKSAPPELVEALRKFPKGADIHNHLSGAVMPEDYLALGSADGVCYGKDPKAPDAYTLAANAGAQGRCKEGSAPLAEATKPELQKLVSSLSMYGFNYTDIQAGHDQFFNTFGRFGVVSGSDHNQPKMLAKVLKQADADGVSYVETMMSFQSAAVSKLADALRLKFSDSKDFQDPEKYPLMFNFLLSAGLKDAVVAAHKDISGLVKELGTTLKCDTRFSDPACRIPYAFLSQVNRNSAKPDHSVDFARIFTQTAFSFFLSYNDDRVVGINLVSGEDAAISMQYFQSEMRFIGYFNSIYPKVNIALHAGEITPCFVGADNKALKEHFMGSLNAGAKRLGHAVSFAYLADSDRADVINLIKAKDALVEIMFTSNAQILGVTGSQHPFPLYYWKYGVPTSFSTDDEGVSHANYTDEWIYAFMQYRSMQYKDLITVARYSQQYSFMPGAALWRDVAAAATVEECTGTTPGAAQVPQRCEAFLARSPKATMQWQYEAALSRYNERYGKILEKFRRGSR